MQTPEHVVGAYEALFADTPNGRMRRARLATVFATQGIEFYAQDVELGFVYPSGAFVADGTPAPDRDPMGQDYRPTTRPGHRLPHCWLDRGGKRLSTHDVVGRSERFALFVGSDGAAWHAAAAKFSADTGVAIETISVDNRRDAFDTEGRWQALREVHDDGAVLVRPDNVVAWRSKRGVAKANEVFADVMTRILQGNTHA
jgi:2,4-dichlorophenol 6-monooxygenase